MAQRLTTSFISTSIPGAYPNVNVISSPVGLGASGNVVIIGEADGGNSYQNVVLSANVFTPDQLAKVQQTYISGQIVDAFGALSAPSADANIIGTANAIYIVKTNAGTQAQATLATNYGLLKDLNWGTPGNLYKYQITQIASENAPQVTGVPVPVFGAALNGASFTLRLNGGAADVVTLSATTGNHSTIAQLITELNSLLPSGIVASQGAAANSLELTVAVDANANADGWGKALELIDSTAGDLAALGLTAGLTASSQEPGIEIQINRADIGVNETIDVNETVALTIGYNGTTATCTITPTALTTAVTGGAGADLNISLSTYKTIADLASFINAQTGYSATCVSAAQQQPPSALDTVAAIGIASAAGQPGRIKTAANAFQKAMATSTALSFVPTATAGLPTAMTNPSYLSGGTRGATLAADIIAAIEQLAGIQVNIIIPLFSQDASADIAAGLTNSNSTYTVAAVHATTKNHCIQYSTPKLKRNRLAILSIQDTYANAKSAAQGLAQYRCCLTFQNPTQVDSAGIITSFQPWYGACVAAGMQAGGFYKAIVNKFANVISFSDPSGFDSGSPGDIEDALDAGMLILSKNAGGNYWVSDQTTYGYDTNFVYNSLQAVYCSDILALDLAASFQTAFVGQSLADVDAATALSFLAQKMDGYKKLKLIASSSDAPLGFKNAKVSISAPEMDVAVEIKLATAIYFIPISISISAVQQSAS